MNTVNIVHDGPVTHITLARPGLRNAFNDEVVRELHAAFMDLPDACRVVVLTGEGQAFCAGADLAWMKRTVTYTEEQNRADARAMAELFATIDTTPRAVVARVNGPAIGGGVGLVACCDIAVAAGSARFGFTEARLGLVPAVISPFVLRKASAAAMRRYFLTGELFDADVALSLGLVHEVVAEEALDAAVGAMVDRVLKCGPEAVAEAKKLILDVQGREPETVIDMTADLIAQRRASPEGQEGLGAFLEKRRPRWQR